MIYCIATSTQHHSYTHLWGLALVKIYRLFILLVVILSGANVAYGYHEPTDSDAETWPQTQPSTHSHHNNTHLPDLDSSQYFLVKLMAHSDKPVQITDSNKAFNGTDLQRHRGYQHYLDRADRRRQQLLDRWMKPFKFSLAKHKSDLQSHHFYVNTLRQEIVGKARIGAFQYSIRASRKDTKLSANYRF